MITADPARRAARLEELKGVLARRAAPEDRDLVLSFAPVVFSGMPDRIALDLPVEALATRMLAAFRFVAREIPHAIQLYKGLPGIHVAARNPNEEEAAAMGTIAYDAATGEVRIRIKANANMLIQGFAGTFRLGTWQLADFAQAGPLSVTVDPYAGIRYTYLDTELKGRLDLPDLGVDARRTTEAHQQWVDPIVGLRTAWTLGKRFSLILLGDVGGISTNSQYSAEGVALIGYRFGLFGQDDANLVAGYRALHQKYEDGDGRHRFDWDVTLHGPIAGLTISF